jgi:hypothetical protein
MPTLVLLFWVHKIYSLSNCFPDCISIDSGHGLDTDAAGRIATGLETGKLPVVFPVDSIERAAHPLPKHFCNVSLYLRTSNDVCFDCHFLPLYLVPGELICVFERVEPWTTGGGGIGKTAILRP